MQFPKRYIDGLDTNFEEVIQSLRSFLCSIDTIRKSEGGALLFFTDKVNSELLVKVFPLRKNTEIFNQKFTGGEQTAMKFFEKLNSNQPYNEMWHSKNFFLNNAGDHHFEYDVPTENVINYDHENIKFSGRTTTWNNFIKQAVEGQLDKSTYEQILFKSGCKKVAIIPLPILSTPGILLAIDYDCISGNRDRMLRLIYTRSRDAISKFLYYRLIDSLTLHLEENNEVMEEAEFVQLFVDELCKILLPYSFNINHGSEINYYEGWPIKGFDPVVYELPLLKGRYIISFRLTSFSYIDLEHQETSSMPFIHTSEMFKANSKQSSRLVCRLFNLLHKNWELRKTAEVRAYNAVSASLSHLNLESLDNAVQQFKKVFDQTIDDLKQKSTFIPPNKLIVENDEVSLTINNQEIISKETCRGNKNQIDGFRILLFLLKNQSKTDATGGYTPQLIFESCGFKIKEIHETKSTNSKNLIKINEAKSDLTNTSVEILETIKSFTTTYSNQLQSNYWVKNKDFNNAFFISLVLMDIFINRKLKDFIKNFSSFQNEITEQFKKLIELKSVYFSIDKNELDNGLKQAKITTKDYENGVHRCLRSLTELDPNDAKQRKVRVCIKSMITKLYTQSQNAQNENNSDKLTAINFLLENMIESGLINKDKKEPASQIKYEYNQQKASSYYISWQF